MSYDDLAPDERGHDCAGPPCPFCEQVVATIAVTRVITKDGSMRDDVDVDDGQGGSIDLATAVGMLVVAQYQMLSEAP